MGLIAIGDIHGCARTLEILLEEIAPGSDDHLIFVGDYVDRGPNSRAVIERLMRLENEQTCTFLRGNHEALFLSYLDQRDEETFLYNGGRSTLTSYSPTRFGMPKREEIPEDHIRFIRRTKLYLETDDFLFVHAGLDPDLSVKENLEEGDEMIFLWERRHMRRGSDYLNWEKTVVCGHTPVQGVVNYPLLINIDTGCVFYRREGLGYLTAVRLPEREFVSVPFSD